MKVTEKEQVGTRLDAFRNSLNLTQSAFAQTIGVQQGFLNNVIRGKKGIGDKILFNIAKAYKMLNLRWLLTGEGEMYELVTLPLEPPPYELPQGEPPPEQIREGVKIEYLRKEGQLESIQRLLQDHERRLRDLECKSP